MVIYTNEGILDIYEGINYPFNYAIGDVRDITKRNIDFSKTIKLPATKNNNKFFEYFFNVNVQSGSFDVNQKEFIRVEENGNIVFEGFLQLLSVTLQDGFNYYEGVVFSSFRNILDIVQDLDLDDLDFSEYNHPYEFETFEASVLTTRKNYKYFDNGGTLQSTELGYGYTYPDISYNGKFPNKALRVNMFPAFFVNEYIEKIFLLAGYKIESKFFETEYFKSLILPFTNGNLELTQEESETYEVKYSGESLEIPAIDTDSSMSILPILPDTKITDEGNLYDINSGILTVNKNGNKNIRFYGNLKIVYEVPAGKTIFRNANRNTNPWFRIAQWAFESGTNDFADITRYTEYILSIQEQPTDINELTDNTFIAPYNVLLPDVNSNIGWDLQFIAYIRNRTYYYKENGLRVYLTADYIFEDFGFDYKLSNDAAIINGDKLNITKAVPKLKITDFLKSIITMFNLYIYPKQDALNTLIIETRDEFYTGNKTHFFDSKLDKSKPIKISTLSEESAKTYLYKYKEGKDYINKEYDAANDGKKYAQKEVVTDNQFLTNTQSYTTSFVATGSANISSEDNTESKFMPVIFDRDIEVNELNVTTITDKEIKSEPRILFYGGNGFAGSFESLNYPTFSLDFEAMKQTSDADEWIPFFDLYNLFHKNTIEEVSSPNAKLLTCYLDLNVAEINIADKIYILGEYWRINKIIDYNANSNDTTKVELFKLKGNINYLTAETIITDYENNTSLFNDKFNNQFS